MKVLVGVNILIFSAALFAPCLKVTPHIGEGGGFDFLGKMVYGSDFDSVEMSIFDTIVNLFKSGDYFMSGIIFGFTVLFPLVKMLIITEYFFGGCTVGRRGSLISKLSKYSMLDVFVIGLILISIKVLPGGSTAQVQVGCVFFFIHILITKCLLFSVGRAERAGG